MPKITDGVSFYASGLVNLPQGSTLVGGVPTGRQDAVQKLDTFWRGKTDRDQFEFDAMMWCGAMASPGQGALGIFTRKLFTVLYNAGVLYNASRDSGSYDWRDFSPSLPLASVLGHGGRVIIQLPVRTEIDNPAADFFDWLVGDVRTAGLLITRSAATHALAHRTAPERVLGQRKIRITERRGKITGLRGFFKGAFENNHFGVNVALGGAGNTNPISGNRILADGAHGHVYIYYNPKEPGQCGGLMIGCENSAPGATSQTFVPHDWRAISEDYSPCGTQKWPKMQSGPNPKAEAMLVDLSDGWTWLRGLETRFKTEFLDYSPMPVQPTMRSAGHVREVMYGILDVLGSPAHSRHRKFFQAQFDILKRGNVSPEVLEAIVNRCEEMCNGISLRQPSRGPRGRRSGLCMPPELANLQLRCMNAQARPHV